jgi:type IV pilus assembly protein PilN
MIRINLLPVEEGAPKSRFSRSVSGKSAALASGAVLLGAASYVGWDFLQVCRAHWGVDAAIAVAQAEKRRLAPVLEELERFEALKNELQQHVTLIEELRRNQVAPVHMLDQISRSLPDRLWLTEMKQTNDDLVIAGRTGSLTALADLVGNLDASGYFKRPVEILSSEEESPAERDRIKFFIKATFVMPGRSPDGVPASTAGGSGTKRLPG